MNDVLSLGSNMLSVRKAYVVLFVFISHGRFTTKHSFRTSLNFFTVANEPKGQ